jgi:hypothetical protein
MPTIRYRAHITSQPIIGAKCKLWSSSLCNFHHPPLTTPLFSLNIKHIPHPLVLRHPQGKVSCLYALRHEDVWGSRGIAPRILNLGTRCRSASSPCHFIPGERVSRILWIWGRVGPKAGLDTVEKIKKYPLPLTKIEHRFRPTRT